MSATAASSARITPEQFFEVPGWERYELVAGELQELPEMIAEGCMIAGIITALLHNFASVNRLGIVLTSDATFQCFPDDPSRIRRPDVSFIFRGRLPLEQFEHGHARVAPDIAFEVVSPNDDYNDVDVKVEEYLSAGVRLVWVVNPTTKVVMVHHPNQPSSRLRLGDELTGEDVLPGFKVSVATLFPDPNDVL